MKKIFLALAAIVCSMSINAQVMKVMKGNEVVATYNSDDADAVVFEEAAPAKVSVFDVKYEALFGYSSKYYYWSKETSFEEKEPWNDGDTDFNTYLVGFASSWFEGKSYAIPCFWNEETGIMKIGTYYDCGEYTATAEEAEQFAAHGVKEGDKLELMTYGLNTEEYSVDFKFDTFTDGTVGLLESNEGQLQVVVVYGNKMLAYMPAKVTKTVFQEITESGKAPAKVRGMKDVTVSQFQNIKPIPFAQPIPLKHAVKTLRR